MELFRTELARAIDALADAGRATVTESRTELALYQLDGAGARDVVGRLDAAGFALVRLADEGGDVPPSEIDAAAIGIELVATKPLVRDGVLPLLTAVGFKRALERGSAESIVWAQGLPRPIETSTMLYAPWGMDAEFRPDEEPADPARVVRFLGPGAPSGSIGRWLLRDPDTDLSGPSLTVRREMAGEALTEALSQEVERDGRLLFRGPPPTRFRDEGARRVEVGALAGLHRAAAWVYENSRELENRHGLLAAEVARSALRDGDLSDLAGVMDGALEGARIAYGFGVSQQSRDALKTLSDLRKAVSDETGKLSDTTRSLAAAVMTTAVGNVGLIVARLTVVKDAKFVGGGAAAVGIALAVYVGLVVASGWHFLTIQRDLRAGWRERLYRFLGDDEYARMVTSPVERAEKGFLNAAIGSGIVTAVMLVAVLLVVSR